MTIGIGDRVERCDALDLKCRAGRVTGFAPNGWVRVRLDNDQQRIWKPNLVRVLVSARDQWLRGEIEKWVARVGYELAWQVYRRIDAASYS